MNAGTTVLGAVLALLMPVAATAEHLIWTNPDPLVAGQPGHMLFESWSYGGDPTIEVRIDGTQILLSQSGLCSPGGVCLTARAPIVAEVMLPSLAAGEYTVVLEWDDPLADAELVEAGVLVVESSGALRVLPAEGFWSPVGQPGSGLFLAQRGQLLALSSYSYSPNVGGSWQPFWTLGTVRHGGDSVALRPSAFEDGDCLDCGQYRAPDGPFGLFGRAAIRLRFESSRRAWLDAFNGVDNLPMISLPFGSAYIPHPLQDTVDAEFGPLPLPDLRGGWVFAIENADATAGSVRAELTAWELDGDEVLFTGSFPVTCSAATEARRAGCQFAPGLASADSPEPRGTFTGAGWFAALGDIQEDRIIGAFEADDRQWRVQGFRTAGPPAAGAALQRGGQPGPADL